MKLEWKSILFSGLMLLPCAHALELEHFGNPPPGKALIALKSQVTSAPLQIAGSAEPPTLLFNGKPLALEPTSEHKPGTGIGLWINGIKQNVEGTIGRFFIQLQGEEASVPALNVVMRTASDQYLKAEAPVDRIFLEAPFTSVYVAEESSDSTQSRYSFTVRGGLSETVSVHMEEGKFTKPSPKSGEYRCELPLGKSVLVGKLEQQGGSERILNVPVKVDRKSHVKDEIGLALEVPGGAIPYQTWEVPNYGATLGGQSIQGNSVFLNDKPLALTPDGKFKFTIDDEIGSRWDENYRQSLYFKVIGENGKQETFVKKIHCGSCSSAKPWYAPRHRRAGQWFLTLPLVHASWLVPRNGNIVSEFNQVPLSSKTQPLTLVAGLGGGIYVTPHFSVEAMAGRWLSKSKGETRFQKIETWNTTYLQAIASFHPIPVLSFGGGFGYLNTKALTTGFSTNINGTSHSASIIFRTQLKFPIYHVAEISPSLYFSPASLVYPLTKTSVRWYSLIIEPLAVRFFL